MTIMIQKPVAPTIVFFSQDIKFICIILLGTNKSQCLCPIMKQICTTLVNIIQTLKCDCFLIVKIQWVIILLFWHRV